ncbi:hypothetical protein CU103_09825 [Phyllobacterium sophorae]|uniref:Uncharacterized protein n=1 Tax=Phyllobacterium sophorae TaxID=1520277 RepID=A0A2P7BFU5_9HYPH|nr:hypothetical protein CU103_09825 [Phyllobacterium sophorae]
MMILSTQRLCVVYPCIDYKTVFVRVAPIEIAFSWRKEGGNVFSLSSYDCGNAAGIPLVNSQSRVGDHMRIAQKSFEKRGFTRSSTSPMGRLYVKDLNAEGL